MRPITKIGLATLLALAATLFVPGLTDKAKASGPYTFDSVSGYYVGADGGYYVRSKVYYYRGCYRYYYWRYSRVNAPQASAKYITPKTEDWRSQLLKIAENRDKYEASVRASALEHSEFLEAVKALGLTGNFNWQNYGVAPQLATNAYGHSSAQLQQSSAYAQQPTPQGSTIYGYSTVADVYGDVDLGALYQQALRLGEQAQQYGSQAAADSKTLISQEGANRARVAAILAEGQVAAEKLRAVRPAAQGEFRTQQFKLEIGNSGKASITPVQPEGKSSAAVVPGSTGTDLYRAVTQLAQNKCVKCHGGAKTDGGLDLSDLSKLTAEQGEKVLLRIIDPDPEKRMPKDGPPLSVEERLLFFRAATPQQPAAKD